MFKALFFDADNTIFDNHKCAEFYLRRTCEKMGIPYTREFYDTYFLVNTKVWKMVEEGKITRPEARRRRFIEVFDILKIDLDPAKAEEYLMEGLRLSHELVEGAEEVLEKLSHYYPIYLASNASPGQQQGRLALAGVDKYFTGFFASGELGAEKPKREFFERAINTLEGVKPLEVMMIGDSLRADIVGGSAYGLTTCWFDFYNNGGDFPSAKPDFTIYSLSELLPMLLPDGEYFAKTESVLKVSDELFKKNLKAYEELS